MIMKLFNITAKALMKLAQKLHLTYNEVNIIVYYSAAHLGGNARFHRRHLAMDHSRLGSSVPAGHLVQPQALQPVVRLGIQEVG